MALLCLSMILLICCALIFLPNKNNEQIYRVIVWASLSILFLMLAVLYLVMYCDLRSTLKENVFKTLDGERQKMRLQFYFFGFGYVFKGLVYGLEAYLWYSFSTSDSQNYKYIFIIYLITALNVLVADAIPIFFIAFVHHTTFRDMSKSEKMYKQAEEHVVYSAPNEANATFLGESRFSILEESIQK